MGLVYEPIFNLRKFYESCHNLMKDREIVNNFDYITLIESYKQKLKYLDFDGYYTLHDNEYYERRINLSDGQSYYNLIWSVELLQKIIKTRNINEVEIDVEGAYKTVDVENISQSRLLTASKNENPIILVTLPFLNPWAIIADGNHRVVSKYKSGAKSIKGYFLTPGQHVNAIPSRFMQTVFMTQYNIWLIDYYMTGQTDKDTFNKSLFPI